MLISELVESTKDIIQEDAVVSVATAFAKHALKVQMDPSHFMYPKINRYLMKGPTWRIRRLPEYWLDKVLSEAPDEDGAHGQEVEWVLDMLTDGLRTARDVGVYARKSFESIFTLTTSPRAGRAITERVLQLLYRAICAGGGTTLITGCGLVVWLRMNNNIGKIRNVDLKALSKALTVNMDHGKVREWGGKSVVEELALMSS